MSEKPEETIKVEIDKDLYEEILFDSEYEDFNDALRSLLSEINGYRYS